MRRSASLAAGLLAVACLSPTRPDAVRIAQVRVVLGDGSPRADTLAVRGTTRIFAAAIATAGYDVGLATFLYESSAPGVATVDAAGVVRGVSPGTARLTARVPGQGVSGSVNVVVVPSTVDYTIAVGSNPGAIAFSVDYTRAYIATGADSLTIVDALAQIRVGGVALGARAEGVAATSSAIYATHPSVDSLSVVDAATNRVTGRIFVGVGPSAIVASPEAAYVALRGDRKIVTVKGRLATTGLALAGEPRDLALSRDGRRLYATVNSAAGWRVVAISPTSPDTLGSVALTSEPAAIATSGDGSRVYVLLGAEQRVAIFTATSSGALVSVGSVSVGSGASGIDARPVGTPYVVVSGDPLTIFNGETLAIVDRVAGIGGGRVAIRPDGVFAVVAAPTAGTLRVIGL